MAEQSGARGRLEDRRQAEELEALLFAQKVRFTHKLNRWFEKEKVQKVNSVRLVLVGKTGVGKSATGNTILGRRGFISKLCTKSVTMECKKKTATVDERLLMVIDTPGLFDTALPNKDIRKEIAKSITMSSPGPHVFLLLLRVGRFTNEEMETVRILQETFGERSKAYTMVGFTRGEEILDEGMSLNEYLENSPPSLQELIKECGGRTQLFCNKDKDSWHQQVKSLLEKVDKMVNQNGGSFYTTAMYEMTEAKIRAREMRLIQQKREELENVNQDPEVSFLANELSKVKLVLEKKFKNFKDRAPEERDEDRHNLEELRANLEKKHDKKINEIDDKLFSELARSHHSIRKQAEKAEAKAIAKTTHPSSQRCITS